MRRLKFTSARLKLWDLKEKTMKNKLSSAFRRSSPKASRKEVSGYQLRTGDEL
jgi:hypothetical protein